MNFQNPLPQSAPPAPTESTLTQILKALTTNGRADIIEEISDTEIYMGFCGTGTTGTNSATWAVLKISVSGVSPAPAITSFKWANGSTLPNLIWDNRATFIYSFLNV